MRIEVIVFDWDGTLVNSAADIVGAMQKASAALGIPAPDATQMRRAIGLGLAEAFARIFPDCSKAEREQLMQRYSEHYRSLPMTVHGRPFAGVPTMLQGLHAGGYTLAVATGKSRAGLDRSLSAVSFAGLFKATRTADESASKPDPLMLDQLSVQLCVEPEAMLMVGDTTFDMEMAQRFGCPAVGVGWGVHEPGELLEAGALTVMEDLNLLPGWLAGRGQ